MQTELPSSCETRVSNSSGPRPTSLLKPTFISTLTLSAYTSSSSSEAPESNFGEAASVFPGTATTTAATAPHTAAMPHVALATVATLVGTGLLVDVYQRVRNAQRAKRN